MAQPRPKLTLDDIRFRFGDHFGRQVAIAWFDFADMIEDLQSQGFEFDEIQSVTKIAMHGFAGKADDGFQELSHSAMALIANDLFPDFRNMSS
jgi:hypothetical protein